MNYTASVFIKRTDNPSPQDIHLYSYQAFYHLSTIDHMNREVIGIKKNLAQIFGRLECTRQLFHGSFLLVPIPSFISAMMVLIPY